MVWKSNYWWLQWLTVPLLPSPFSLPPAAAGSRAELDWESSQGSLLCWVIFNLSQLLDQAQHFVSMKQLFWHCWSECFGGGKELCRARMDGGSYFSWPCCQNKCRSFFHWNAAQCRSAALRTLVHRLPLHHLDLLWREEEEFSLQSPSREFPV